jgi:DNA-binding NtrC family response regulator
VERAVILASGPLLEPWHFPELRADSRSPGAAAVPAVTPPADGEEPPGHSFHFAQLTLSEIEREVIEYALGRSDGNRTRAAELLGLDVRTLRRKLNPAPARDDAG